MIGIIFRGIEIFAWLFYHALGFALSRVKNVFRTNKKTKMEDLAQIAKKTFESLGPSFLKIGQLLSTREDLLPISIIRPLKELQDQVKPLPWKKIKNALDKNIVKQFSKIEPSPIAAASIAQVHLAQVEATGEILALKIQRPGIARKIKQDIKLLKALFGLLEKFTLFKNMPLVSLINEAGQVLQSQYNFQLEAANNQRFQEMFEHNQRIYLPNIHDKLSSEKVLAMHYIGDLRNLDDPNIPIGKFLQVAKLLLHATYRMIFTHGFVHCDMHPANICLDPQNNLVILDTGFVTILSENQLVQFNKFFNAIIFNDGKECAKILHKTAASQSNNFNYSYFETEVIDLIQQNSKLTAGNFNVPEFAFSLFDVQRKNGLRGSVEFTLTILALLVVEGVVKHRLPDLNFQQMAVPYLNSLLINRLAK